MTQQDAIETLLEISTKESEAAAIELGKRIKFVEDAQKKLTMLLEYRDDYEKRFQERQSEGLSMMGYRNFQVFIDKLDVAVDSQRGAVEKVQQSVDESRKKWQETEKKKLSYKTLVERKKKEIRKKEERREQKLMDEFVTNKLNHKR